MCLAAVSPLSSVSVQHCRRRHRAAALSVVAGCLSVCLSVLGTPRHAIARHGMSRQFQSPGLMPPENTEGKIERGVYFISGAEPMLQCGCVHFLSTSKEYSSTVNSLMRSDMIDAARFLLAAVYSVNRDLDTDFDQCVCVCVSHSSAVRGQREAMC